MSTVAPQAPQINQLFQVNPQVEFDAAKSEARKNQIYKIISFIALAIIAVATMWWLAAGGVLSAAASAEALSESTLLISAAMLAIIVPLASVFKANVWDKFSLKQMDAEKRRDEAEKLVAARSKLQTETLDAASTRLLGQPIDRIATAEDARFKPFGGRDVCMLNVLSRMQTKVDEVAKLYMEHTKKTSRYAELSAATENKSEAQKEMQSLRDRLAVITQFELPCAVMRAATYRFLALNPTASIERLRFSADTPQKALANSTMSRDTRVPFVSVDGSTNNVEIPLLLGELFPQEFKSSSSTSADTSSRVADDDEIEIDDEDTAMQPAEGTPNATNPELEQQVVREKVMEQVASAAGAIESALTIEDEEVGEEL